MDAWTRACTGCRVVCLVSVASCCGASTGPAIAPAAPRTPFPVPIPVAQLCEEDLAPDKKEACVPNEGSWLPANSTTPGYDAVALRQNSESVFADDVFDSYMFLRTVPGLHERCLTGGVSLREMADHGDIQVFPGATLAIDATLDDLVIRSTMDALRAKLSAATPAGLSYSAKIDLETDFEKKLRETMHGKSAATGSAKYLRLTFRHALVKQDIARQFPVLAECVRFDNNLLVGITGVVFYGVKKNTSSSTQVDASSIFNAAADASGSASLLGAQLKADLAATVQSTYQQNSTYTLNASIDMPEARFYPLLVKLEQPH